MRCSLNVVAFLLLTPLRLSPSDIFELAREEADGFLAKQSDLNNLGVTVLLATVLMSLSGRSGPIQDAATALFIELLNGGNLAVQDTLFAHLDACDAESRLVSHADAMLELSLQGLQESRKNGHLDSSNASRIALAAKDCETAQSMARFLQLLCEGHHLAFQNYLRVQPAASKQADLVKRLAGILVFLCDSTHIVR